MKMKFIIHVTLKWKHMNVPQSKMAEKNEIEGKLVSLPLARIKTIMKSSPESITAGQESIFTVARATVSRFKCITFYSHYKFLDLGL